MDLVWVPCGASWLLTDPKEPLGIKRPNRLETRLMARFFVFVAA
jgi:hypothetical protein